MYFCLASSAETPLWTLLEQAVDLQQRRVVGARGQQLGVGFGGFETGLEVGGGHGVHGAIRRKVRIVTACCERPFFFPLSARALEARFSP